MSGISAIKVYGERNTGTNYVSELLRVNFGLPQLPGTEVYSQAQLLAIFGLHKLGLKRAQQWLQNRTADRYHASHFSDHLGWKHACIPVDRVASLAVEKIGILGIVKNPYAFITSMHRRPYQAGPRVTKMDVFSSNPFPTHDRDLLGDAHLSLVEIWNRKTRSYFDLTTRLDRAQVVRYEDLLADEAGVLSKLCDAWGLEPNSTWQTVEASTKNKAKGEQKSRSWYARYYLQQEWRSDLSDAAIRVINSQLDLKLMEMCGYDLIEVAEPNTEASRKGASIVKTVLGGTPSGTYQNGSMWAADGPLSTSRLSA